MDLNKEMETSGNWLFRHRSYLPLLLVVLIVPAMLFGGFHLQKPLAELLWKAGCMAVSFVGLVIRAITIGHVPARTSGRNTGGQIAEELNTSGIYSTLRHPLYLGNFFLYLGAVLFAQNVWAAIIYILVFWLYYERIMYAEESFLKGKFGDAFAEWSERTPAFFPSLKHRRPAGLPFSFRNVLKRENNGLFGMVFTFFLLNQMHLWLKHNTLRLSVHWLIFLIAGFVVWIALRLIKKHTAWLKVQGR
jgi:protein-S-isoprenylcysteine O-methyltransferase Ste14